MKEIGVTMVTVKSFAQMSAVLDVFVGSKISIIEKEGTNWNDDLNVNDYNHGHGAGSVNDQLFFGFFPRRQIYWYHWQSRHHNARIFDYRCSEINANGVGKGLQYYYLNTDCPFISVLKLDSKEYKNADYQKDADLTFRNAIKPLDLDNESNVQNGANDDETQEDLTDTGDNDDETDLDLILNLFDDENENEEVFDQI